MQILASTKKSTKKYHEREAGRPPTGNTMAKGSKRGDHGEPISFYS